MRIEECVISAGAHQLAATRIHASSERLRNVISFHGTGVDATRARIRYLFEFLAGHGVSSACFDFSGHGDSTGIMADATLALRLEEALAATRLLASSSPLAVIGTSMGAAIASMLVPVIQPRILILFCPAAYPEAAMNLKLDEGFAPVARRPGAYLESRSFRALNTFQGRFLLIAARKDSIIPREIIEHYAESVPLARSRKLVWLEESDHKIHRWLEQHEPEREMICKEVLSMMMEECREQEA